MFIKKVKHAQVGPRNGIAVIQLQRLDKTMLGQVRLVYIKFASCYRGTFKGLLCFNLPFDE